MNLCVCLSFTKIPTIKLVQNPELVLDIKKNKHILIFKIFNSFENRLSLKKLNLCIQYNIK